MEPPWEQWKAPLLGFAVGCTIFLVMRFLGFGGPILEPDYRTDILLLTITVIGSVSTACAIAAVRNYAQRRIHIRYLNDLRSRDKGAHSGD